METSSFIESRIVMPLVGVLMRWRPIAKSNASVWYVFSLVQSVLVFILLWVHVRYWSWYIFLLLWAGTFFSVLCGCLARQIKHINDRTVIANMLWLAQMAFSAQVSVLGALHVLDVGVYGTLVVCTLTGFLILCPHWAALVTGSLDMGAYSSPTEIRVFATTMALLLSPLHPYVTGHWIGSLIAVLISLITVVPIVRFVDTARLYATTGFLFSVSFVHFLLMFLPPFGMVLWAIEDPWMRSVAPVTFAGMIVFINTQLVARLYFDRAMNEPARLVTFFEFLPIIGVVNCYLHIVPQPFAIAIVYVLTAFLTVVFVIRTALIVFEDSHVAAIK